MALYRDLPNHCEDASDPEKTVERVLDIAHVLFHLDQVGVQLCRTALVSDNESSPARSG